MHYEWIKMPDSSGFGSYTESGLVIPARLNGEDVNFVSQIGPGRLHLVPHVNAPVADFPVRRVVGAHHFLADLTLPYGRVVYDYNKQGDDLAEAAE